MVGLYLIYNGEIPAKCEDSTQHPNLVNQKSGVEFGEAAVAKSIVAEAAANVDTASKTVADLVVDLDTGVEVDSEGVMVAALEEAMVSADCSMVKKSS
ncbi:hypothetical protein Ddc_01430 [Ditylenchus destructor]|nr:hypothetical protein Ddc_01430 [Ditylenchus destructor]